MSRRFVRFLPSPAMAVALAAVAASAAGLAVAAIPDSKGVIHSCYSKSNGALRVVKGAKCHKGEKKLKWNQQGRPGHVGGVGPSDIYAAGTAAATLATSYVTYGTLSLPPGSYLLEGKATVIDSGAGNSEVTCSLTQDTTHFPDWDDGNATLTASGARETIALSAVQRFTANQHVAVICKLRFGTASIDDARVIAVKTGALHGSTPVD